MSLAELDPLNRFSDRAADYVKYRPTYPAAAIDVLLAGLGPVEALLVADVGAGTGISARLVADRGARVVAVEPNRAMRDAAQPHPRVEFRDGAAEATGLAAASLDLLLCAQAFHWFQPGPALLEFARVLRPGARLALMWNSRSREDPFTVGYRQAILDAGAEAEAERMPFDPTLVPASGYFPALRLHEYPNVQRLDRDGLIGRTQSASYVPKEGPKAQQLIEAMAALHRTYADADGTVSLVYTTQVWLTERG